VRILLTLFVVPALLLLWERLRLTAGFRRPRGGVVRDTAFNLAEIELPPLWRPASNLHSTAPIQALDPLRGRYAIVISDARLDFDAVVGLTWFSETTLGHLAASSRIVAIRGPEQRTVAGLAAAQYELDVLEGHVFTRMLHTSVEGHRAFHQIICWAQYSRYDRKVFEELLDGFKEPADDGCPECVPPGMDERVSESAVVH
jgi:hypothetical protein